MKIINLIENTEGAAGCSYAHGLSFYIEVGKHKILFDLGPSGETLDNARKLRIDLTKVDTVVLSHGHYDHSGGILPFAKLNPGAQIIMQKNAGEEYYADDGVKTEENTEAASKAGFEEINTDGKIKEITEDIKEITEEINSTAKETKADTCIKISTETGVETSIEKNRYRYIGIDKDILKLPQVKLISGDYLIDEGIELFTLKKRTHKLPFTNKRILEKVGDKYIGDEFDHEHYLVIREQGRAVLISGCAHNGIISITDAYMEKYGSAPDLAISGFHLMKKTEYTETEITEIREIAETLRSYPTEFITCHCTGTAAYDVMKEIMKDKLNYVHSGERII